MQSDTNQILQEAKDLHSQGQLNQAQNLYKQILEKNPQDSEALRLLGLIAHQSGQKQTAIELLEQSIAAAPKQIAAYLNLASIYEQEAHSFGTKFNKALGNYYKVLEMHPHNPKVRNNISNLLQAANRIEEALDFTEETYKHNPNNIETISLMAYLSIHLGDKDLALKYYQEILDLDPNNIIALFSLITTTKVSNKNEHITKCENLLQQSDIAKHDKILLYFALAKAYEDLKDYDRSFDNLVHGNQLKKSDLEFDLDANKRFYQKIKESFSDQSFAHSTNEHGKVPIFIVGLPRSGSSLIEQILASHSRVLATGELFYLQQCINEQLSKRGLIYPDIVNKLETQDLIDIQNNYFNMIDQNFQSDRQFIVDKMPSNFKYIGMIKLVFPNAKIIHSVRNPLDLCFACYKKYFPEGQAFSFDLEDMSEYYSLYGNLMQHWHQILPDYILDVHYEELVTEQKRVTQVMLELCGLDWEDECLEFYKTKRAVKTASLEQVKQPLYSSSINHWQNYEKHLGVLINKFSSS